MFKRPCQESRKGTRLTLRESLHQLIEGALPNYVIIQPSGPLLGPFRVIFAHDDVAQSQPVRLEYRHDPTEGDQRRNLCVPI